MRAGLVLKSTRPTAVRTIVVATVVAVLMFVVPWQQAAVRADPSAAPTPEAPCPAQTDNLQSVQAQIDAHNAQPHTFIVPDQQAQFDAYNAEAAKLNSDKDAAAADLLSCSNSVRDLRAGAQIPDPRPETITKISSAKAALPPGYSAPAPPPTSNRGAVRVTPELRPLYKALRDVTPQRQSDLGNVPLQGKSWPAAGDPDPVYPSGSGRTIGTWANGNPAVSADHVIPLARLLYIPGFLDLPPEYMYMVAQAPVNLQWLSQAGNSSKGSANAAAVMGADPAWVSDQQQLEDQVLTKLEQLVAQLKSSLGMT